MTHSTPLTGLLVEELRDVYDAIAEHSLVEVPFVRKGW